MAEDDLEDIFDQTDEAEIQLRKRTFAKVKENSFKVSRRIKHKTTDLMASCKKLQVNLKISSYVLR